MRSDHPARPQGRHSIAATRSDRGNDGHDA